MSVEILEDRDRVIILFSILELHSSLLGECYSCLLIRNFKFKLTIDRFHVTFHIRKFKTKEPQRFLSSLGGKFISFCNLTVQ